MNFYERDQRRGVNILALAMSCLLFGSIIGVSFGDEVFKMSNAEKEVKARRMPNIVILYADDAGYSDFGFQPTCQEEMKKLTPYIDSIAASGARFTNAYMSGCVCSPSRAGLMTGRYQQRFGYGNNLPPGSNLGLDIKERFGVQYLKEIGYHTALIGKWHLGYRQVYHPNERGFDWFYGLLQGARRYDPLENPSPHQVILENKTPTKEQGYVTDRFGDAACDYIKNQKGDPFYLLVSFTAPHSPLQPKKEDLQRVSHIKGVKRQNYAGLLVSLDDNVGKILTCLRDEGLEEDTLVIFTNDNGGQTLTGAINTPLRGRKGTFYEGGIRVPWAMRWAGRIPAGLVVESPVTARDLLPTFLAINAQEVKKEWKLDGESFWELLDSNKEQAQKKAAELQKRALFWRQRGSLGQVAMREGSWKLVQDRSSGSESKPELYHLPSDESETINRAEQEGARVQAMMEKLSAWEKELKEPLWGSGSTSGQKSKQKRSLRREKKSFNIRAKRVMMNGEW